MSTLTLIMHRICAIAGAPAARLAMAEGFAGRDAHASAFPLFAQAAQAGLSRAQYFLGRCYLLGLGVPPSAVEALRWLRRSAEAGEAAAQTQLGALALQGVSDRQELGLFGDLRLTPDFGRAEYWCRKAVTAGSAEAKALLGFILTEGPVEGRDLAAGEGLYREAAESGWSRGQLGLAMALLRNGTAAGAAEAETLLRSAAADGVAMAHHLLGMLAESGATGSVDFIAAAGSYRQAAQLGHIPAQVRYGFALLHGRGVAADAFNAETWLRRAALAGDAQAAAVVGYIYARDGELPSNLVEAAVWLRRAAELGHVPAARILGRMLLSGGAGISRDVAEAVHWLRLAAGNGDEEARGDMIRPALTGQIGEEDQCSVGVLLRESAMTGDAAAQFHLGVFLARGIGVEQDELAALAWFHRSAGGGQPDATRMLAQLEAGA